MKKILTGLVCTSLLVTSISLHAANSLNLGEGVSLIAVNGKEMSSGSLLKGTSTMELPNGSNQLLINYTAEIKRGNDYELEQTAPAIISFTSADQVIEIKAPGITSERSLRNFELQQNWIVTADQKALAFEAELLPLEGFRIGVNYERELADFNKRSGADVSFSANDKIELSGDNEQKLILRMLHHWYELASPQSRHVFLLSIQ
ncbi:DUF2057 domain-containing protein [Neptuniibacter caesariensis]|uniref:Hypothetical membrane associated protein n=1 Tax=Neptuniibacter caesariensis TaxID=207954 RepID=A0A7U8C6G0_NEPCE|nr:DUF2057 domain-containing protein [Neptuniibacter caesariensis]EAR60771.1 hypothetical membrane associated protein [Neptuniibacter caesariensis]